MTDGLIAIWDDSKSIKRRNNNNRNSNSNSRGSRNDQRRNDHNHNHSQEGSLYSTDTIIFGKQRGTISACPTVNPHLFVTIRDEIIVEQESIIESTSDGKGKGNGNGDNNGMGMLGLKIGETQDTQDLTDASATASSCICPELDETDISSCLTGTTRSTFHNKGVSTGAGAGGGGGGTANVNTASASASVLASASALHSRFNRDQTS